MSDAPIDEEALVDLADDPEFLETLIRTFQEDCSEYLTAIRTAVEEGDTNTLMRQAHGLKGAAANMQAEATQKAAHRLEEIGRSENLERAPDALRTLEESLDQLIPALDKILAER